MSLAKRIIATVLVKDGLQVVSRQFNPWRTVGHPEQAVRVHNARGIDELVILDIGATDGPDFDLCAKLGEQAFMPVTYGGGVRSVEDARRLLHGGADKVAVGQRLLVDDPGDVAMMADCFGSQAVVGIVTEDPDLTTFLTCKMARRAESAGVGEILLQNETADGEMSGYALTSIEWAVGFVNVPIIAGSGCGNYDHMVEALEAGAAAVAAGAMWQFTDATPRGAAEYLNDCGWEVRL